MLKTKLIRAGVVGIVATSSLAVLPQAAMAAGNAARCTGNVCSVTAYDFPGGTISIDADASGSALADWQLRTTDDHGIVCSATFPGQDPPRSWVCHNVPAGRHTAYISGVGPTSIGLRW